MNQLLKMHLPASENLSWNQQQPFLRAENHPHLPIFKQKSACKVLLYNSKQMYLGLGIFSPERMQISFVSHDTPDRLIDQLAQHLSQQWIERKRSDTNAMRLIHHKEDGLPGVCIDVINHTAVIQTSESGADLLIEDLAAALQRIPQITSIYLKNTQRIRLKLNLSLYEHWLTAKTPTPILQICEENFSYEYNIEHEPQLFPLNLRFIRKWIRQKAFTEKNTISKILLINLPDKTVIPEQHKQQFQIEQLNTARMPFTEITAQLRNYSNQNLQFDLIVMKTFHAHPTPRNITALHHLIYSLYKLKSQMHTPLMLVGVGDKTAWHLVTRKAPSSAFSKPIHTLNIEPDFPNMSLFQIEL